MGREAKAKYVKKKLKIHYNHNQIKNNLVTKYTRGKYIQNRIKTYTQYQQDDSSDRDSLPSLMV